MSLQIENFTVSDIKGLNVTVMGLGLNGGGLASAEYFASNGANVTVTDLRSRDILAPSIKSLEKYKIRYVLEKHDISDFINADLVIKNPAVKNDSPYLAVSKVVETDISIFMRLCKNRIIAVTGSKGKSTTVSALYHSLKSVDSRTKLGGNITTSPLSFINETDINDPVILELSSWQLADLKGKDLLAPFISIITNILPDHQNRYSSMDEYADDKKIIYSSQGKGDYTICSYDDAYGRFFFRETKAKAIFFSQKLLPPDIPGSYLEKDGSGYFSENGVKSFILDKELSVKGNHNRLNLLAAASALYLYGIPPETIRRTLSSFKGIRDRLELVAEKNGMEFYNDTTATIPEAVVAAVMSFGKGTRLIAGGTDKELDFEIFSQLDGRTEMIYLLDGSATGKIIPVLEKNNIPYKGPFSSLEKAFTSAVSDSSENERLLLSPGCASFEMFKNEFERGDVFRKLVLAE